METQAIPKPSTERAGRPARGTFYHLQVVLGVAFILATLFTAWTPAGGFPDFNNPLPPAVVSAPKATPLPEGAPTATPRLRPLIGIVSGHWGNDSGAVCEDGLTEVEVNQKIAILVQKILVEKGYDVDVLREFDTVLAGYQASALVSIHADSCDFINDQAKGFKVASALASAHPERAARLTACLRNRYAQVTDMALHSTSVTPDMTSYHAFDEIDDETTAAIIEVGFLNQDRHLLTQEPEKAAQGIVNGILCFINNEDIAPATAQPTP